MDRPRGKPDWFTYWRFPTAERLEEWMAAGNPDPRLFGAVQEKP